MDKNETIKVYRISSDGGKGGLVCHGTGYGFGDVIQDEHGQVIVKTEAERDELRREEAAEFLADDAAGTGLVYDGDQVPELEPGDIPRAGCRVELLPLGLRHLTSAGQLCRTRAQVLAAVTARLRKVDAFWRIEVHDEQDGGYRALTEEEMTLEAVINLGEFDGF